MPPSTGLTSTTGVPSSASRPLTRSAQPVDREHRDAVQADRVRAVRGAGVEHALLGAGEVAARVHAQDVAARAVEPGEQQQLVAGRDPRRARRRSGRRTRARPRARPRRPASAPTRGRSAATRRWRPRRDRSAVAGRVRRAAGVLHLDHVAPAVGPRAVDVGEAVLLREPAGGERPAVPALRRRGRRRARRPRGRRSAGVSEIAAKCGFAPRRRASSPRSRR